MFKKTLVVFCLAGIALPTKAFSNPLNSQTTSSSSSYPSAQTSFLTELSVEDYRWIGERIYQNECNSQSKNLTFWGKGEDFPSLGIGHFIWFPKGVNTPFTETFPAMFEFVSQTVKPPQWLLHLNEVDSPWQTKEAFEQAWSGKELSELRYWLEATQAEQAQFIVNQFETRVNQVLSRLSSQEQAFYAARLMSMMRSKKGRFAVIDYVNFKGVGGNLNEQYQGEEWGLLSVLKSMSYQVNMSEDELLLAFSNAAKSRLLLRTQLAPSSKDEARWLKGWYKRLEDYL